jgi:hypothetical protein
VPQPSPLPEQGYAWYVRARNPYGSTWSPGKLFNVFSGVRPVAPTLLAPIGIISDTTPVYTWSDGGDAYDFMLLVVDSQRNREIHDWYLAADICNGTVCTVTQTVPLTNDNYIWYLKARNPAGATWAVGKRFTVFTGGPVGVATPIMPAGIISDTTPTYTWGEGSDAVDYQLLLFNSSGSLIRQLPGDAGHGLVGGGLLLAGEEPQSVGRGLQLEAVFHRRPGAVGQENPSITPMPIVQSAFVQPSSSLPGSNLDE